MIDDLTGLLQAQKAAAWQEVAQRIAHEIKNPLTPIQLSAQRLLRHLDRTMRRRPSAHEFEKLTAECARPDRAGSADARIPGGEFSQFARFPAARLAPANVNSIVEGALELFQGPPGWHRSSRRIGGRDLPPVKADTELMRQVVANLIDNAAEAMEGSPMRRLR